MPPLTFYSEEVFYIAKKRTLNITLNARHNIN